MTLPVEPVRGGFRIHPFGTAVFIRDYLMGRGPQYGVPAIEPRAGAPQADIHAAYKDAILFYMAQDLATAREEEDAAKADRGISPEKIEDLTVRYMVRIPSKLTSMRYHSFVTYFRMMRALGWVERTGKTEPSALQDEYPEAPPRVFYRITAQGRAAPLDQIANPLKVLYPGLDSAYFRLARELGREKAANRARAALEIQGRATAPTRRRPA